MPGPARTDPAPARPALGTTLLALGVALALGVTCALHRSIWVDELHSLHHARASGVGELIERALADNHPPLYFALLALVTRVLGTSEPAMRVPGILFGLGTVLVCARLARRASGTWAPVGAALALALSSLFLLVSAEARMYSLLSLAVAGLLLALVRAGEGRRVAAECCVWVLIGLHTHYYFVHYLALLAGAWWWWTRTAEHGAARRSALAGLGAGVALSLPWYLWALPRQLGHGLAPGGEVESAREVLESVPRLEFYNLNAAPAGLAPAFELAAALLVVLLAATLLRLVRKRAGAGAPLLRLAAVAALGVPLWAGAVAALFPRAGFNMTYLAPSCVGLALLVTAQPRGARMTRAGLALVLLAAAGLSSANALSAGNERYREAVARVAEVWRPGDGFVAIDPAPPGFPRALGWSYYADLFFPPGAERPTPIPIAARHRVADPAELEGYPRMLVLQRHMGKWAWMLRALRRIYAREERESFGWGLWLHVFSEPRESYVLPDIDEP